jgi:HSP20 family protein
MTELIPTQWQTSIERLRENINYVFERYLSKFKSVKSQDDEDWSPTLLDLNGSAIELDEDDDRLTAYMALPGLSPRDIKVEATQDRLVVRGSNYQSSKKNLRDYSRYVEQQAAFAQAVVLPCAIDRDRVKAKFKNGLLTITMPKRADARSRRLKISVKA